MKKAAIIITVILSSITNIIISPILFLLGALQSAYFSGMMGTTVHATLVLIGISAVCIVVERWIVWNRTCGKRLVLIEVGLVLVTTLFYWLLLLRLPFPTLNRML